MKYLLLFFMLSSLCFAQSQTLEERVTNLEQKISDLGYYIEENCELVYDYAGSSTIGCYNSFISNLRTDIRVLGTTFYVTNWMDCRKYRLVCR